MKTESPKESAVRLDKWLWAARFFKTRALATEAITGGKVHADGHRAKAAKIVKIGELLKIRTGFDEREVIVQALSGKRGPASLAVTLYEETPESIARRLREKELRQLNAMVAPVPSYRPTKKDRRLLEQLKGK